MPHTHTVQPGDTLIRIAHENGFADWRTIWQRDENAALRDKRDHRRLAAGDEVFVPDKAERWVRITTDQRHVFELARPLAMLRVALTDRFGDPITRAPYEVTVDGTRTFTGHTSAAGPAGLVECPIAPDARAAVIRLLDRDLEWAVELGALPPLDQLEGVQLALQNLGYLGQGQLSGALDEPTKDALGMFQGHARIPVTRALDDATKKALDAALFTAEAAGPAR